MTPTATVNIKHSLTPGHRNIKPHTKALITSVQFIQNMAFNKKVLGMLRGKNHGLKR